jgi:septal ring factor EnvC (AmiA/AmiB activator)
MPSHSEQIDQIRAKVMQFARQYKALETEHEKLKAELEKKNATETQLREKSQAMEKQLKLLKAASGLADSAGRKELEKQINHYIREIDRCITLLGEGS